MTRKISSHLGYNVQYYRKQRKISQKELAALINVSHQQIHKYESGKDEISNTKLDAISKILEVPIADLMEKVNNTSENHKKIISNEYIKSTLDKIKHNSINIYNDTNDLLKHFDDN